MIVYSLFFVVLYLFLERVRCQHSVGNADVYAICDLQDPMGRNDVRGRIFLHQTAGVPLVRVSGQVYGAALRPGLHGFHVHEEGNYGRNCSNARGHFNPFGQTHASPFDQIRHAGDLGNIIAVRSGFSNVAVANVNILDWNIRLIERPELTILGRSIVVHADPDDLGRGGNEESLRTGNAGARLACCRINQARAIRTG